MPRELHTSHHPCFRRTTRASASGRIKIAPHRLVDRPMCRRIDAQSDVLGGGATLWNEASAAVDCGTSSMGARLGSTSPMFRKPSHDLRTPREYGMERTLIFSQPQIFPHNDG